MLYSSSNSAFKYLTISIYFTQETANSFTFTNRIRTCIHAYTKIQLLFYWKYNPKFPTISVLCKCLWKVNSISYIIPFPFCVAQISVYSGITWSTRHLHHNNRLCHWGKSNTPPQHNSITDVGHNQSQHQQYIFTSYSFLSSDKC